MPTAGRVKESISKRVSGVGREATPGRHPDHSSTARRPARGPASSWGQDEHATWGMMPSQSCFVLGFLVSMSHLERPGQALGGWGGEPQGRRAGKQTE